MPKIHWLSSIHSAVLMCNNSSLSLKRLHQTLAVLHIVSPVPDSTHVPTRRRTDHLNTKHHGRPRRQFQAQDSRERLSARSLPCLQRTPLTKNTACSHQLSGLLLNAVQRPPIFARNALVSILPSHPSNAAQISLGRASTSRQNNTRQAATSSCHGTDTVPALDAQENHKSAFGQSHQPERRYPRVSELRQVHGGVSFYLFPFLNLTLFDC
jgi:hypothetical protein